MSYDFDPSQPPNKYPGSDDRRQYRDFRRKQHARRHGPPPWWPEGEEWPPHYPADLRNRTYIRKHIFRRLGCFFLLLFLLFSGATTAFLYWITTSAFPGQPPQNISPLIKVGLVILVIGALISVLQSGRYLRSTASQMEEMMSAIGKLAGGEYDVKVKESGPREDRALARALNSLADRLHASYQQRRQMLADVSHELRTPLTVIQGDLEGMIDGIYPADANMLQAVLDETHTLSRIIDDLRTLSLAETGSLKLQFEQVSPAEVIEDLAASFRVQAEKKGVNLETNLADGLPEIECDPVRIHEVLANLVANALRYTPADGRIQVSCDSLPGKPGMLRFRVADTGSGIPPEDLPHIFDRFYKSADSTGSGLGLAISKSLVVAHGGEIFAESAAGPGTVITVWLPVRQESE
jgi:signal transduction histidine kinase